MDANLQGKELIGLKKKKALQETNGLDIGRKFASSLVKL